MADGDYSRYRQEEAAAGRVPITLSSWQKRERRRKNPPIPTTNRTVRAPLTASGMSVEHKPTRAPGGPVTAAQSPIAAKVNAPRCLWWEERVQTSTTHGNYPLQVRCSLVRGHDTGEDATPHWHDRRDFNPAYQFKGPRLD